VKRVELLGGRRPRNSCAENEFAGTLDALRAYKGKFEDDWATFATAEGNPRHEAASEDQERRMILRPRARNTRQDTLAEGREGLACASVLTPDEHRTRSRTNLDPAGASRLSLPCCQHWQKSVKIGRIDRDGAGESGIRRCEKWLDTLAVVAGRGAAWLAR